MSEHLTVKQLRRATQQTQEWLNELEGREPFETEEQAYSHLRAVLHAVRDRLTVEEAVHLGQQLPMIVRGFYYEGWQPSRAPDEIETQDAFFRHVESSLGGTTSTAAGDLDVRAATQAVLRFLDDQLQDGTLRHVKQQLPDEIRELFGQSAQEKVSVVE